MAQSNEKVNFIVNANNPIVEMLAAPLQPDWNVEGLAEQLLSVVAAQRCNDVHEFVLDENATTNRQVRRLIPASPRVPCGQIGRRVRHPVELFGGGLSFKRSNPTGTMWILGHFDNRPAAYAFLFIVPIRRLVSGCGSL